MCWFLEKLGLLFLVRIAVVEQAEQWLLFLFPYLLTLVLLPPWSNYAPVS
uniref:Uncharacterized protein n=1 Tax=Manihot esculenta TaxID=3983 RepID=A0A2C9VDA3_MANES